MLLRFEVKNYRSFRDEAILDMEAVGLADHKDCLLCLSINLHSGAINLII